MTRGYFRFPAVFKNKVVFTSEDDLWEIPLEGGARPPLDCGTRIVPATPVFLPMAGSWHSPPPRKVITKSTSCQPRAAIFAG